MAALGAASTSSAEPTRRVERGRASVGEGGQDLAGRLRVQARVAPRPWVGVEMHADAGRPEGLLAPATDYFRIQPMIMLGLAPRWFVEIFAGAGLGAAELLEGVCSDGIASSCAGLVRRSRPSTTLASRIGARYARGGAPLLGSLRLDAIPGEGARATLLVGLELGAPAPRARF